jgi:hypothetical protein
VEAHLYDRKPFGHHDFHRCERKAGDPVHLIGLRVAVDDGLVVLHAEAAMKDVPFATCPDVEPGISELVGLRLGPGWRGRVKDALPRRATCTHLTELLGPAITTLYQMTSSGPNPENTRMRERPMPKERPFFFDGCYSWRADGPVARELFPQFADFDESKLDEAEPQV